MLAYLTTALGLTTGAPVASATVTVLSFASSGDITPARLFSGITLGPGNYYLTLFDVDPTADVAWAGANSVTTASGFARRSVLRRYWVRNCERD